MTYDATAIRARFPHADLWLRPEGYVFVAPDGQIGVSTSAASSVEARWGSVVAMGRERQLGGELAELDEMLGGLPEVIGALSDHPVIGVVRKLRADGSQGAYISLAGGGSLRIELAADGELTWEASVSIGGAIAWEGDEQDTTSITEALERIEAVRGEA